MSSSTRRDIRPIMAEAIKFTFDEMFDTPAGNVKAANQSTAQPKKTRWTDEEIEAIKAEARAEGMAEAMSASETKIAEATAASFDTIAAATSDAIAHLAQTENDLRSEAASLALGVARKLADVLITLRPEAEIEAVIRECMTHLNREPRLVVRVNNTLADQIESTIQQAAIERGMADKIMIVGDANIETGDCEIEWSDGGVARNRADLDRQATEIINRYAETLTGGTKQPTNEENNDD